MTLERLAELFDAACSAVAGAAAYLFFFGGALGFLGIIGQQCVGYLHTGEWVPLSAIDLAGRVASPAFFDWLMSPDKWVGVHRIMESMPASGVLLLLSWIVAAIAYGFSQALKP